MLPAIKDTIYSGLGSLLVSVLIITLVSGLFSIGVAQAQQKCDEELAEAEQKYNSGRFDEAIELIGKCLEKPGITEEEKKKAYRLLGLTYIAKDYLEEAKTAVRRLLDLIPNYKPDTVQDPPTFTNLVEEVRDEMQAEKEPEPVQKAPTMQRRGSPGVSPAKPIRFGFRGGLNLANMSMEVEDEEIFIPEFGTTITIEADKNMRTTFGLGGFMEYWFSPTFALQFNALYNIKGAKVTGTIDETITDPHSGITVDLEGEENDIFKVSYLSFPVLTTIALGRNSSVRPYIVAGPEIGILLSAEQTIEIDATASAMGFSETVSADSSFSIKDDLESIDFALNLGGGLTIPLGSIKIFIDGRYGLGLTKINKEDDESIKNSVIYINAGLVFGSN